MVDFHDARWIFEPKKAEVGEDVVKIVTEPRTDLWQRSYYGFRNDNAPGLLLDLDENFTFIVRVDFEYKVLFDQCGVLIYLDSENWFKASIEFENEDFSRLGSVVTNYGYSDWATSDIDTPNFVWFRLSRRGSDFLIESSFDGEEFHQMRIFHLHKFGETTELMGKMNPPQKPEKSVAFGIYACSPLDSSFEAVFSEMKIEDCVWRAHGS